MIATRELVRLTLGAFATGGVPPVSGTDARALLEVIAACYRSAQTGRRLSLDGRQTAELSGVTL